MIEKLAPNLKQELFVDIYVHLLKKTKNFWLNFSKEFLQELCLIIREQTFGPGEIIYKEGDKSDKIYFILKGEGKLNYNFKYLI